MGNSLRVVVDSYIGSASFPCHLQLGKSAFIDLSRELGVENEDEVVRDLWTVSYEVHGKSCQIYLIGHGVDQHGKVANVEFSILGRQISPIDVWLVITENKFIKISSDWMTILFEGTTKKKRSFDARGGVMDTSAYLYGNANDGGLFVLEAKKNSEEDEGATVVTVAHYFVYSSGTSLYRSAGTNIGLSMIANFRVSNGNFHITVDGPVQHPVSALLYLFDEVNRTGIWKPTMCPHCDHIRRGKVFWQSDSEDMNSVPIPQPRATQENARGVPNGGRFQGNGNSTIYENNAMNFRKRWLQCWAKLNEKE